MRGFGSKDHHIDPTKLPILVHAVESADAFALCQKVWQANHRSRLADAANQKEFLRFVFSNPACVVWLQHDLGRTDAFELILMWEGKKEDVTEVYAISWRDNATPQGDDTRTKSLLTAILSMPAVVPVAHTQHLKQ